MQLIRPDEGFRFLCDLARLVCGQKLRAYRRVKNVEQDAPQARAFGVLGGSADDVAHERLGDARVHAVHAHMVAVVGRPAERKLAEVARADHKTARAVCDVHQFQRPDAGLRVFICDVQHILALTDVGEVAADGVGDGDLTERDLQLLAQKLRV